MDATSKPAMPDNAEETMKCPICGAMVNLAGNTGGVTCPVCGRPADPAEVRVFGASNEGF